CSSVADLSSMRSISLPAMSDALPSDRDRWPTSAWSTTPGVLDSHIRLPFFRARRGQPTSWSSVYSADYRTGQSYALATLSGKRTVAGPHLPTQGVLGGVWYHDRDGRVHHVPGSPARWPASPALKIGRAH